MEYVVAAVAGFLVAMGGVLVGYALATVSQQNAIKALSTKSDEQTGTDK